MDSVYFDLSSYPLISVVFSGPEINEQVLERFFRRSWALMQEHPNTTIYVLYDISSVKYMSEQTCAQMSDWMRQHQHFFCQHIKAIAYVNTSVVARVLLHQIYKNYMLEISWQSFADKQQAQDWLSQHSKAQISA